jgi:hypothetical protein
MGRKMRKEDRTLFQRVNEGDNLVEMSCLHENWVVKSFINGRLSKHEVFHTKDEAKDIFNMLIRIGWRVK